MDKVEGEVLARVRDGDCELGEGFVNAGFDGAPVVGGFPVGDDLGEDGVGEAEVPSVGGVVGEADGDAGGGDTGVDPVESGVGDGDGEAGGGGGRHCGGEFSWKRRFG